MTNQASSTDTNRSLAIRQLEEIGDIVTVKSMLDRIEHLYKKGWDSGISTGYMNLDGIFKIFKKQLTTVSGIPGHGKALALDTKIPTLNGWKTMGDISLGDIVFDENGKQCKVTHVFDVMEGRPCYEIIFENGERIIADAEHGWLTRSERARYSENNTKVKRGNREETAPKGKDQRWKKTYPSVVTTEEIRNTLTLHGRANHAIRKAGAVEYDKKSLPIPPYTLGAWLGNGTSSGGSISCPPEEIIDYIREDGFECRKQAGIYAWGIIGLQAKLRSCGLLGNKHIPHDYLSSSIDDRISLLAGLCDTDGGVASYNRKSGNVEFCNTNKMIAFGFLELVRSLGISANISESRAMLYGKDCGPRWRIIFTPHFNVFRYSRKKDALTITNRNIYRKIKEVNPVTSVPVRCISVDSGSHLYLVTEHFIPTHNSEFMDALMINTAMDEDWKWGIFSPENYPHEIHFQKLAEKITNFPFRNTPLPTLGTAIQFVDEHMIWANPKEPTVQSLKEIFKTLVMTHGVDGILLDPYNEIEHKRPSNMSEHEYISWFLTDMRRFARMYDVALYVVAHPTKLNADKQGTDRTKPILMNSYDINGSAAWANKSDNIMVVYRPDFNKHETQIHMQKVKFKFTGQRGFITLKYAYDTGRYFI